MPPRLGEDALAVLWRDPAPDVIRCQDDPDGAHPANEEAAKGRHGGILVVAAAPMRLGFGPDERPLSAGRRNR